MTPTTALGVKGRLAAAGMQQRACGRCGAHQRPPRWLSSGARKRRMSLGRGRRRIRGGRRTHRPTRSERRSRRATGAPPPRPARMPGSCQRCLRVLHSAPRGRCCRPAAPESRRRGRRASRRSSRRWPVPLQTARAQRLVGRAGRVPREPLRHPTPGRSPARRCRQPPSAPLARPPHWRTWSLTPAARPPARQRTLGPRRLARLRPPSVRVPTRWLALPSCASPRGRWRAGFQQTRPQPAGTELAA